MKVPKFWLYGRGGISGILLLPISMIYWKIALFLRHSIRHWRCTVPVICVGNLIVGGAGKTPVVIDLAHRLVKLGMDPHLVTRGYGGTERGPVNITIDDHDPNRLGDESRLLSSVTSTWVSKVRQSACLAAVESGAKCIVFDDGFQDPSVANDLSILVVDGGFGFGNGRMIPAGPLREPIAYGLSRANVVVLIGKDTSGVVEQVADRCPLLRAYITPDRAVHFLKGKHVLAFAGIGRPDKFFGTLRELGCELDECRAFSDHHYYSWRDLKKLKKFAQQNGLILVTTEKDLARIPPEWREGIISVSIKVTWKNEREIDALLQQVTGNAN